MNRIFTSNKEQMEKLFYDLKNDIKKIPVPFDDTLEIPEKIGILYQNIHSGIREIKSFIHDKKHPQKMEINFSSLTDIHISKIIFLSNFFYVFLRKLLSLLDSTDSLLYIFDSIKKLKNSLELQYEELTLFLSDFGESLKIRYRQCIQSGEMISLKTHGQSEMKNAPRISVHPNPHPNKEINEKYLYFPSNSNLVDFHFIIGKSVSFFCFYISIIFLR